MFAWKVSALSAGPSWLRENVSDTREGEPIWTMVSSKLYLWIGSLEAAVWGVAWHLTIDQHSAVKRKQLDGVVEAAHRIFVDALQIEIAFDEVGERTGQQYRSAQLFGEGFETRRHVDRRTDDREVESGARPDIAVHDVPDVDANAVIQRCTAGFAILFIQGNHGLTGFGHCMQQICAGRRLAERKNREQPVADELQC
jgi:hypothetical protein